MENIVVVFDFDKTIIEVDSDNWLLDELGMGFTKMFEQLLLTTPWNTAMDMMMSEVHRKGISVEDIVGVLRRIPIHPRMVPTIKSLYASGCCLRIVSDANMFFIETILEHVGLRRCFSNIDANPGFVEQQLEDEGGGRIRIQPHHTHFPTSPHSCTNPNCAPNMCKGNVVERVISEDRQKRFIYLGDGKGDHCPLLKLRSCDVAMPRIKFPIWELINGDSGEAEGVKGRVQGWSDGGDLEVCLPELIHSLSSSHLYTTSPVVAHCNNDYESSLTNSHPLSLQVPS